VNRMVLGDSLVVMSSLLHYEGLGGQVQTIYMDPPYGVKFGSNFQPFVRKRDVKHNEDDDMTREPEMVKAYRDTWELGLHSYLTYMRDRLLLARELLTPSGSIFVQISDENLHHVRELMDEVFGEENYLNCIPFVKTAGITTQFLASNVDFLLWYAKDRQQTKYRPLFLEKSFDAGTADNYGWIELPDGKKRGMTVAEKRTREDIPVNSKIYKPDNITSQGNPVFEFEYEGKVYSQAWKTNISGMKKLAAAKRLHVAKNYVLVVQRYLNEKVKPIVPADRLDIFLSPYYGWVIERLVEAIQPDAAEGEPAELPRLESNRAPGTTSEVDFWTSRDVREVLKSHINFRRCRYEGVGAIGCLNHRQA
jgi:adenine-specific DNA-methyltransferase